LQEQYATRSPLSSTAILCAYFLCLEGTAHGESDQDLIATLADPELATRERGATATAQVVGEVQRVTALERQDGELARVLPARLGNDRVARGSGTATRRREMLDELHVGLAGNGDSGHGVSFHREVGSLLQDVLYHDPYQLYRAWNYAFLW